MSPVFRRAQRHLRRPPGRFRPLARGSRALLEPARLAGYSYIETPVFEDTALFERGVGESTDVVTRRCTPSPTRATGRSRCARRAPRASCGLVARAPAADRGSCRLKVWYAGPMFRYERRRPGGSASSSRSASRRSGSMTRRSTPRWSRSARTPSRALGLERVELLLTSLGDPQCRPAYVEKLRAFLREPAAAGRGHPPPRRAQPAARAGRQAARGHRDGRRRAADGRSPVRRLPGALRRRARAPHRHRHRLDRGAAAGPRARLLPAHHLRVAALRPRRAERGRRRRALRRAVRVDRRPAAARHRLGPRHGADPARARRRGRRCPDRRPPRVRRLRRRRSGRRPSGSA